SPYASPLSLLSPAPPTPEISSLSLHDALPISQVFPILAHTLDKCGRQRQNRKSRRQFKEKGAAYGEIKHSLLHRTKREVSHASRSEEHTSELQSRFDLVCRLLLEKKKHTLYRR